MASRTSEILLADADVLIDYIDADQEILARCVAHFASLHVMQTTLDEVEDLDPKTCQRLGITIVAVEDSILGQASEASLGLSVQDTICLLVAEERQWTCVTNEKALRKRCDERGVRVRRGLNLMIELVRVGHLGPKRAENVARAIQKSNPEHIHDGVISEFLKEIGR